MIDRRDLLLGTAVAAAATAAGAVSAATSASGKTVDVAMDPWAMTPEHKKRHLVDFPKFDADSHQNFANGIRRFMRVHAASTEYTSHTEAFLKSHGLSSLDDVDMTNEAAFALMVKDPVYAARSRLGRSNQSLMWDRSRRAFHKDADYYLRAMEETDKKGPGTLELNPDMVLPDYVRYEIHTQPGGYVGDAFAGWIYHYSLNSGFYQDSMHGDNLYDEIFHEMAQRHPKPADGNVRRILDIGSGCGMYTVALKERFPEAEVWGLEIAAPMVRYAHHRAVKQGIKIHYAQRLAEDTKFPDGYFDLVTDHILFHEASGAAGKKIIAETARVLRPGGIFNHMDMQTNGNPASPLPITVLGRASRWNNHRHNVEPWEVEYRDLDFPQEMRNVGFDVDLSFPPSRAALYPGVVGVKRA